MRPWLGACEAEWKLLCGTHNLLKLWRHTRRQAAPTPLAAWAAKTTLTCRAERPPRLSGRAGDLKARPTTSRDGWLRQQRVSTRQHMTEPTLWPCATGLSTSTRDAVGAEANTSPPRPSYRVKAIDEDDQEVADVGRSRHRGPGENAGPGS